MATIREKMEAEIVRGLDQLKQFNPESEEYQKITQRIVQLGELINKGDEIANKVRMETERLEAEARQEAEKRGSESEKLRFEEEKAMLEEKRSKRDTIRAYILGGLGALVTTGTFVGTWIFNARAQARSEFFEENGHAYTSRFSRFQLKEPNHPSVKM